MEREGGSANSGSNFVSHANNRDERRHYGKLSELQKKPRIKWRHEESYRNVREQIRQDLKEMEDYTAACRRLEADIRILKPQREAIAKSSETFEKMWDAGYRRIHEIGNDIPRIELVAELVEEGVADPFKVHRDPK